MTVPLTLGDLEEITHRDQEGRVFLIARVPRIKRRFVSSLHAAENLTSRLGAWRTEEAAFRGALLPTARLYEQTSIPSEQAAVRRAVVAAIEEGYAASLRVNAEGEVYGYLARPDRIADTVDLDALHADWTSWLTLAGVYETDEADSIREDVKGAIEELRESCYSHFLHKLGDLKQSYGQVYGALMDGIVLGDDPGSTCAFLLKDLTGDGRLWESQR
jgi:hypothetical protein